MTGADVALDARLAAAGGRTLPLVAAFAAAALAWAALGELEPVARAPARIMPSSGMRALATTEGGVVVAVAAVPGVAVAAGAELVRLVPAPAALAESERTRRARAFLDARLARLTAERDGGRPGFASAIAREAPDAVAAETAQFAARRAGRTARTAALAARTLTAVRAREEAAAALAAASGALAAARAEAVLATTLVEKGLEPAQTHTRARAEVARLSAAAATSRATLARARAAADEAAAAAALDSRDAAAALADARARALSERADLDASAPALAARARATVLRAPVAGVVGRVAVAPGGVAPPGATLIELVPTGDPPVVEARVLPRDLMGLRPGTPARVRVDDRAAGGADLAARVATIAPAATVDAPGTPPAFTVRLTLVAPSARNLPRVGAPVTVELPQPPRPIWAYLLEPFDRARREALTEP